MHNTSKKHTARAIAALEAKRDIGAEILQSVKEMKAGKGKVVLSPPADFNARLSPTTTNPQEN